MRRLLILLISGLLLPLAGAVSAEKLNETFGIALFDSDAQWDFNHLRKRTGVRLTGNSNRFSAKIRRDIAGCRAEELIIYTSGSRDRISRMTFVFANKGDTSGRYQAKIKESERILSSALTRLCGRKQRRNFISGNTRNRADLWETPFADIYLEVSKKEFLMLHIMPRRSSASTAGASAVLNFKKNISRNKFGDVHILNIPMVDQGAKGYCVPATMERIFLYFGVDLDMHHIAEIGDTGRGGGTYVKKMLRDIASLRRKSGLKQSRFSTLSVKTVKRHIDQGFPVLWMMFSTDELHELYVFSRQHRHLEKSPKQWAKKIRKIDLRKDETGAHVCLITGYNPITDEIAVSNSWGQAHIAPIWIPVKAARKVSQNDLMVFRP